jgi:hypothetical protein
VVVTPSKYSCDVVQRTSNMDLRIIPRIIRVTIAQMLTVRLQKSTEWRRFPCCCPPHRRESRCEHWMQRDTI